MKKIFFILFVLASFDEIYCQEPIFVQFNNNPIYLNPSLMGQHKLRATSMASKNWSFLPDKFNNTLLAIDGQLESKNRKTLDHENPTLNYAISYRRNSEGQLSLTTDEVSGGLGVITQIHSLVKFRFAITTKIGRRGINWNNAVFVKDLDPLLGFVPSNSFIPPNSNSFWYKNVNTGVSFRLRNRLKVYDWEINTGISFSNIISQENSFFYNGNSKNLKTNVFFIFRSIKRNSRINGFYSQQLFSKTLQFSGEMKFKNMIGGITYRSQFMSSNINNVLGPSESLWFNFSFLREFEDSKFYNISYSAGITLSELGFQDTFLSHEISMQIFKLSKNELSYSHAKDWFCPGDKGVRKDLNLNKQNIDKLNKKRAKKRSI